MTPEDRRANSWDGILEAGEHILWQGQPEPGIIWRNALSPLSFVGGILTLFSLFWIGFTVSLMSGTGVPFLFGLLFPLFGVPFLAVGLFLLFGHLVFDSYQRMHSWYSVSTRRAFVARDMFGKRSLQVYEIARMGQLELQDGAPGNVIFGEQVYNITPPENAPPKQKPLIPNTRAGFYRIYEPRLVFGLLQKQRSALRGSRGEP